MNLTEQQVQTIRAMENNFGSEWNEIHNPFPNRLYHYTSAGGLIGIFSSKSIWITDLKYMNDMSELQYAKELIESCIADMEMQSGISIIQKEFLSRIHKSYNPFEHGSSVYSASFCENGNLLSQWRAYRGQGGGYAIGFDFFHMLRLLNKNCALRKVIYDKKHQEELVKRIIQSFVLELGNSTQNDELEDVGSTFLPVLCQSFAAVAGELLFCLKHPDFHEEREWRLVHFSRNISAVERDLEALKFREYQGNIIPYYSVSFEKAIEVSSDDLSGINFPIRETIIGPTINSELNQQSISSMLYGLCRDIEPNVIKSEIPLRWL